MMMMMIIIKLPKFTRPLYGVGEHNTKIFFFFFLILNSVLLDPTAENFAYSCTN